MNDECVIAVYDNVRQVQLAVRILHRGGFPTSQISVVSRGLENQPEEVGEIKMGGDDSVRDAAVGAGLGGVGGALAGMAMSAVFGLGTVFFFGPLGLAMMGVVVGAFLGSIGGWGVHEERIRHYEELVKQGKLLLIADGNPLEVIEAERMLKETDSLESHAYAKSSDESPEVNPAEITGGLRTTPQAHQALSKHTAIAHAHSMTWEESTMPYDNARERFKAAIGILVDEKSQIKERLLIAYASQLSRVDRSHDLPASLATQFDELRNGLSDAAMPYGYGEPAAKKLRDMSDDQASELARSIFSMFLRLYELEPEESSV